MTALTPEADCPCPNDACERRTHCEDCFDNHVAHAKPIYCVREGVSVTTGLQQRVQTRKQAWESKKEAQ